MRTYTLFFTQDQLDPILEMLGELEREWQSRRKYVPEWDQRRGDALLANAVAAVQLMNEKAD